VATFLTTEWVDAVNAALTGVDLDPNIAITVGHLIGSTTGYALVVRDGQAHVVLGGPEVVDQADVVLLHDEDVAVAIHSGALSAQQAVEAGRLKLRGDTQKLIANAAALAPLRALIAGLG
jgi:hypothetical protein